MPHTVLDCPHCQQPVEDPPAIDTPMGPVVTCPHCGGEFSLPDPTPPPEPEPPADRINLLRARAIATERRAILRTRTYAIVGLGGAVMCVAYLTPSLTRSLSAGRWQTALLLAVAILACIRLATWCVARIRALSREIARPLQTDPDQPPDFTGLHDGRHPWQGPSQGP